MLAGWGALRMGTTLAMKARHPGQVGVPEWWPWLAWPATLLGLAAIVLGVVQVVSGDLLGWQAVLLGLILLVLAWLNAFALGTTRPGRMAVSGAQAHMVASRHRYGAGVLLVLAVAAVAVAVAVGGNRGLAADPPPDGVAVAVTLTLGLAGTYLLQALVIWLRARLIDSWA
jgi:hypothetical protein